MINKIKFMINKIISALHYPVKVTYHFYLIIKSLPRYKYIKENEENFILKHSLKARKKKCLIIATYKKCSSDIYFSYLANLFSKEFDVIWINNADSSDYNFSRKDYGYFINRCNCGRDFGAYKLGINLICRSNVNYDQIVLMNDTIFINDPNELIRILVSIDNYHVAGHTYSAALGEHLRSYLLSFNLKYVELDFLERWFQGYKLYNSRYHAIINGEVGFGKHLYSRYRFNTFCDFSFKIDKLCLSPYPNENITHGVKSEIIPIIVKADSAILGYLTSDMLRDIILVSNLPVEIKQFLCSKLLYPRTKNLKFYWMRFLGEK